MGGYPFLFTFPYTEIIVVPVGRESSRTTIILCFFKGEGGGKGNVCSLFLDVKERKATRISSSYPAKLTAARVGVDFSISALGKRVK